MGLLQAITESLGRRPGKVLCRDPNTELTAEQVLGACRCAAGAYARATAGGMVGVLLPNCALYPPAVLGAVWAGKVPVLLNPQLKPAELDFIFRETGIDSVVVSGPAASLLAGLPVRGMEAGDLLSPRAGPLPDPVPAGLGETAVLLYTSGTTGRPKGVPLTHGNLLSNARTLGTLLSPGQDNPDEVFLGVLPLFHAFGLTVTMLVPLLLGCEVTYSSFAPRRTVALLGERRVTVFSGVPSMYALLVRSKAPAEPMRGLRFAVCGGDALPARVREAYRDRFGRDLLEGYGLTETSAVVAVNMPDRNRPGTVGRPLPGVAVRIAGEQGAAQPPGTEGEIQVRGPNVMGAYYLRPEETRAAFTPDGWFRTGDLGSLDAEGYLTVSGRIKEVIVRGGEKIMPREVEGVLEQHPNVLEAAVVGEPDGEHGEAVVAFVAPGEGAPTAEELRAFCRGRLAEFKVPRRFVIAADLPRGPTGKVLKRALKGWKPVPGAGISSTACASTCRRL
jgi:long-chain acyl-CoA synthetase